MRIAFVVEEVSCPACLADPLVRARERLTITRRIDDCSRADCEAMSALVGEVQRLRVQLSEERPSRLYGVSFDDFATFVRNEFVKRWPYPEVQPHLLETLRVAVLAAIGPNAVRDADSLRPPEALQLLKEMRNLAWGWKPNRWLHADEQALFERVKEMLARGADSVAAPEETKHE